MQAAGKKIFLNNYNYIREMEDCTNSAREINLLNIYNLYELYQWKTSFICISTKL